VPSAARHHRQQRGHRQGRPLAEASLDDWQAILDVNLSGVFYGCRAAAPYLIRQQTGKVINLASVLAAVGLPGTRCTRRARAP